MLKESPSSGKGCEVSDKFCSGDEMGRLDALRKRRVLDTPQERAFDDLTLLAARATEAPISLISLVDERRQWFKSKRGLSISETPRDISFCARAIQGAGMLVVPDAAKDGRFARNPWVLGEPRIRFYAGAPLVTADGFALGTLCVMDFKPRELGEAQMETLAALGRQVVALLEARGHSAAAAESEARYRTLFDHAQTGIVLADARSVYIDANARACEMLGYSKGELVGLRASDIVAEEEAAHIAPALRDIQETPRHRRNWRFRRKNGSTFPAEVVATRMPDGTLLGVILDVSDREMALTSREQLAAVINSSQDAIIGSDMDGVVRTWNMGAQAVFGHAAEEMVGTPIRRLIPESLAGEEEAILETLREGRKMEAMETRRQAKDGRLIEVSLAISPIRDGAGRVVGGSQIARDITALKEREREAGRLSRLHAALSRVNHAMARQPGRAEMFHEVCGALVELGGLRMAWIGWHDRESGLLVPAAQCGAGEGCLGSLGIHGGDPESGGPAAAAFHSGRPCVCNDLTADQAAQPWRAEAARAGGGAAAAFPVRQGGEVRGILGVLSAAKDFFHHAEAALLSEAATNLSFALDNQAREEASRQADQLIRSEKQFSDTMIDSMPGILYFYDTQGRFLRWNQNFEMVSGYAREEIAGMHPLDFFAESDKSRVRERIEEVFERGESSVEADFVGKDGRRTPYFFTGRRVEFHGLLCLVGVGIDISERRRVELRLAESEQKYRELVELANSIILRWNSEGRVTFLNEFGQKFFGYAAKEIIGLHVVGSIVPETESGGRDLGQLMAAICADPDRFEQTVNENIRRNGERVWIAWTNRIVYGAEGRVVELLSIGTDVTERKRAEFKLRESEAHLVEAQRIAKIGSWRLDLRSGELAWSDQVYEIFGLDKHGPPPTHASFLELVHPLDMERFRAARKAAEAGKLRLDIEHRILLRDGSEKHVRELADLKRDQDGNPIALAGTIHDMTDRMQIELEREKRHRAEAADRVKSAFLATMSHELRTPLNSIIGFTGIVLQGLAGPLNPEQAKQLGMVRGSARHLLELINDVLDISKIEAGQLEVRAEPFDLKTSVEHAMAVVKPLADKKGLSLALEAPPEWPEMRGDRRRVEQILLNLLNNGVKFTEHGGVSLAVEPLHSYLPPGGARLQPAALFRVSDTGMGIKPEELATLFQPFRQLDTGLARQYEGTGLGLAICRKLAELLGGEISAKSEWRRGSQFTFVLPLSKGSLE